jgi:hypothetical protein
MKNEPDYKEIVNWAQIFPSDEKKLGEYLVKSGRPVGCRLDFRITSLEELKKCAVIISELNQKVQHFAYEVDGDPIIRVMLARQLFADSQFQLKYVSSKSFLLRAKEKLAAEALHARSEKLMQKQLKLDLENAMKGISTKRAKDISDARAKQDRKSAKSKPVIDLGDMSLGSLSEAKKDAKVVNFAVRKTAIGYR